jgi:hypothetical protein
MPQPNRDLRAVDWRAAIGAAKWFQNRPRWLSINTLHPQTGITVAELRRARVSSSDGAAFEFEDTLADDVAVVPWS